ncbi:glucose-6-phosphate 1-dehydrogenase [Nematocida displodere]|uniref:Glucose-6-phosphate 1-dehydrogenase n=1 Tax=Nematocida displodere TaxID=1805483 RepID=A0A177ECJ1_9MICR|nr:glucose-6-phosphate 1-dehydrogenase [Nematocida displodere]
MLVIIGATGDLCKKKIFPALDAMLREKLSHCTKTDFIEKELEHTSGTLSSSVSTLALKHSPITHANPANPRNRKEYLCMDEAGMQVTQLEQGNLLKNSGEKIPAILGYARTPLTTPEFLRRIDPSINFLKETVEAIEYVHGSYEECIERISGRVGGRVGQEVAETVYFYLAVPPEVYPVITAQVASFERKSVILAEKPHGTSLETFYLLKKQADALPCPLLCVDHYLFKNVILQVPRLLAETVLGQVVKPGLVKKIKGCFNEVGDVKGREGYYNASGACRDVVQNHLLQSLSILLSSKTASKLQVLQAIEPLSPENTKYGGYEEYVKEIARLGDKATAETYVKTRTRISGGWGVPLTLEGGKKLKKHFVGFLVTLSAAGIEVVRNYTNQSTDFENKKRLAETSTESITGMVRIEITPKETATIYLKEKKRLLKRINLPITRAANGSTPYQTLFKYILSTDTPASHFSTPEEVEQQWKIVEPILNDQPRRFIY